MHFRFNRKSFKNRLKEADKNYFPISELCAQLEIEDLELPMLECPKKSTKRFCDFLQISVQEYYKFLRTLWIKFDLKYVKKMECLIFCSQITLIKLFLIKKTLTSFFFFIHKNRGAQSRPPQTRYSPKLFLRTWTKVEIVAW